MTGRSERSEFDDLSAISGFPGGPRKGLLPVRVLIPDGDSPFALLVAQCIKRADPRIRVEAAYVDRRALSRFSRFVSHTYPLDPSGPGESLTVLLSKNPDMVLMPVSGPGIATVTLMAAHLGKLVRMVPFPTPDQLGCVNDKWKFHLAMQAAGFAVPDTVLLDSLACLEHFGPEDALLVKPRTGSGGKDIHMFGNAGELRGKAGKYLLPGHPYMVQRFVEGHDIDCSVLCKDGQVLACSVQRPLATAAKFGPGSVLRFLRDEAVEQLVQRIMFEFRWNGIAHLDLRYARDGDGPFVIEINPRYWSTLMGSLVAGVNFPWAHLCSAMDDPVTRLTNYESYYSGIRTWPSLYRKYRTPLSHTSLFFNFADPVAKVMQRVRPSTSMAQGAA